jgi:hypothetical protein
VVAQQSCEILNAAINRFRDVVAAPLCAFGRSPDAFREVVEARRDSLLGGFQREQKLAVPAGNRFNNSMPAISKATRLIRTRRGRLIR